MKKKTSVQSKAKKSVNTRAGAAGAHGSKAPPRGDEHGPKWRGGGKKGEDE